MKKYLVLFGIIVIIVISILYGYFTYRENYKNVIKDNLKFEYCYNQEIYGTELATIINKAIENNEKNNIPKNNKGFYEENDENSIKIEIKIIDNNTTYNMETFYMNGIEKFVKNFNVIKFKCTQLKYHSSTKRISYLYFEQLTT